MRPSTRTRTNKAFLKPRKSKGPRYATVAAELQDLSASARSIASLSNARPICPLAAFSRRLLPWDVTTVYPLVMRLWARDMEDDEKAATLEMLLSLIVRRGVCELTTKNYNKFFLTVIAHLDQKGWSAGNLAAFLLAQNPKPAASHVTMSSRGNGSTGEPTSPCNPPVLGRCCKRSRSSNAPSITKPPR